LKPIARLENITQPTQLDLLVAFTDLAGFHKLFVMPGEDRLVFDTMRDYYSWAGKLIQERGGTVIKCIGDAIMLVFPADQVDQGVMALRELKSSGDAWLKDRKIPCYHVVKAHLGPVIAGPVGAPGQERLDVCGKTVNTCATLDSKGFAMTPQVFKALSPNSKKFFKKYAPREI
jgi:adenylate cyclase